MTVFFSPVFKKKKKAGEKQNCSLHKQKVQQSHQLLHRPELNVLPNCQLYEQVNYDSAISC